MLKTAAPLVGSIDLFPKRLGWITAEMEADPPHSAEHAVAQPHNDSDEVSSSARSTSVLLLVVCGINGSSDFEGLT